MNRKFYFIFLCLLFVLIGCNKYKDSDPDGDISNKEVSIEVIKDSIPDFVYVDDFDISDIKIKVNFLKGDFIQVDLKKDMLSKEDQELIKTIGMQIINVNYKGFTDKFIINVRPLNPTKITITSKDKVVFEGSSIFLDLDVVPKNASKEVIWTMVTPDLGIINQEGKLTALKTGKAIVKATSKADSNISATYEIPIWHSEGEAGPNLNDYNLIIMVPSGLVSDQDPFNENYPHIDKLEKQNALREVEDRFNIKIIFQEIPTTTPPFGPERISWIINKAEANESIADVMVNPSDWIYDFANAKTIEDLSLYYSVYGRNHMATALKEAGTYQGSLYHLTDNTLGRVQVNRGLVFNVELLNSLGLENPARLFNEGKWTWSKFTEYVTSAASILDDGQSVLSGKIADLYFGMINASGVKLVDTTNNKLNFKHSIAQEAINLIQALYGKEKVWGDNLYEYNTSFYEGRSIFQVSEYSKIKSADGFSEDLWGEDTKYGFVPFPYSDNLTKEETKTNYEGTIISYQILKGRDYPEGIDERQIFRALSEMLILTRSKIISNPEFSLKTYSTVTAREILDDEESVNAVAYFTDDYLIYDPLYKIYSAWEYMGPMIDEVVIGKKDYLEVFNNSKLEEKYREKLNQITG